MILGDHAALEGITVQHYGWGAPCVYHCCEGAVAEVFRASDKKVLIGSPVVVLLVVAY